MFFLLVFLVHQWSVGLFRMMGALCRNLVVANAVGMMTMLLVFLVGSLFSFNPEIDLCKDRALKYPATSIRGTTNVLEYFITCHYNLLIKVP